MDAPSNKAYMVFLWRLKHKFKSLWHILDVSPWCEPQLSLWRHWFKLLELVYYYYIIQFWSKPSRTKHTYIKNIIDHIGHKAKRLSEWYVYLFEAGSVVHYCQKSEPACLVAVLQLTYLLNDSANYNVYVKYIAKDASLKTLKGLVQVSINFTQNLKISKRRCRRDLTLCLNQKTDASLQNILCISDSLFLPFLNNQTVIMLIRMWN